MEAAAAAAAAAADADAAAFLQQQLPEPNAAEAAGALAAAAAAGDPAQLAAAINGLVAGVAAIGDRLAALELNAEGASLGGLGGGGGAGEGVVGAGAGDGVRGVGAPAYGGLPPVPILAGGDAGLPKALVDGIARAIRAARRGRGGSSSDDDDESPSAAATFTDHGARRAAHRGDPLEYFQLPPCARTSFPSPYRMETLRYRDDFPLSEPCAEANEARHLTIIGAWSSRIHNEILAFTKSTGYNDPTELQALLLRSRVYHGQLAELCAARYDVLKEPDAVIAAQLQERMLAPKDTHASLARRNLDVETLHLRDRGLNKTIVAAQIKEVNVEGRRRGKRGGGRKRGDGDAPQKA